MRKEKLMNLAGVIMFYLFIVLSVIVVNARIESVSNGTPSVSISK